MKAGWRSATAVLLMLAACDPVPPPLPAEPSSFVYERRYVFGDSLRARDVKAGIEALDALEPVYGKIRRGVRQLPRHVSPLTLRRELAARLETQGWSPARELDGWPTYNGSYAFGWKKDGHVYAIVGLKNDGTTPTSPVNILTSISGETRYVARSGS